jgi:hypothetical protein
MENWFSPPNTPCLIITTERYEDVSLVGLDESKMSS